MPAGPPDARTPEPARARAPEPVRSELLVRELAGLPVFARITDIGATAFILHGDLSDRRAHEMEALARAVATDVVRRFVDPDAEPVAAPVDVCLFEDDASYDAFVERAIGGDRSSMGFYLPRQRVVVANLGRSIGNLRHELVHPIIGDDFPDVPGWLNEGLGSLYGTARLREGRFQFLVNYRLRDVRRALRRGDMPTVDRLARSTSDEIYGPRSMMFYGLARHVLLYLDARGELDEVYRTLRSGEPTAERHSALLQQHVDDARLHAWLRRLRIGRVPRAP